MKPEPACVFSCSPVVSGGGFFITDVNTVFGFRGYSERQILFLCDIYRQEQTGACTFVQNIQKGKQYTAEMKALHDAIHQD